MNRKQVLKNMKKNKKKDRVVEEENYVNRFIFTIFILLVVFIIGYFLIGMFITKTISFGKKDDKKKEEVTIDNDTILAGQIFDQKDEEYYVLIYDASDDNNILKSWKTKFSSTSKVYEVDSSIKLNSKYIVDKDSNKTPEGYSDLKIKSPTLIKISNKKVTEYVEGEEKIKNIFKK